MRHGRIVVFILLAVLAYMGSSCVAAYTTTKYNYIGNVYEDYVGKTKNEIVRTMGMPDRETDDGAGGEILAYESITIKTTSNTLSNTSSAAYAAGYGNGVYSKAGAVSETNVKQRTTQNTTTDKKYVYLYIGQDKLCYDFKANCGAKYEPYECFDSNYMWNRTLRNCLYIIPIIWEIPKAIITNRKAKKMGLQFCNE